ncbi:MAG: PRC-barrel domain containing protein [Planctomycetota bacterium]|nr:MAG: PRC-barrel domain containing protein [Planctomycetota bacterium]
MIVSNTTFLRAKGGIVDSDEIVGCKVENPKGENLGKIESVMLDLGEGRVIYAVLSFGGFLGMGDKLFPVPIDALSFKADEKGKIQRCILDIDKDTLKDAPGYDKDNLPSTADRSYASSVYTYYGYTPWWGE